MILHTPPFNDPVDEKGARLRWSWLQWFQNLYTIVANLIATAGGQTLSFPSADLLDTGSHTAAGGTPTIVAYDTPGELVGFTLTSSDTITATYAGLYNVAFSFQLANSTAGDDDFTVWFKKNGTNIDNTSSYISVPKKHGATDGHSIIAANFHIRLAAGDTLQVYWMSQTGAASIVTIIATTIPLVAASPGSVLTIDFVSV